MPDYKQGKIYTIRCKTDDSFIYVGSTCQPLSKRMVEHRSHHALEKNQTKPLYIKMKEIGLENFYIELYEDFPCERREQLNRREGEIIRKIGNLNSRIAGRIFEEYLEENKEKIKELKHKYYEDHKETILNKSKENLDKKREYDKLNYQENKGQKVTCECGCTTTKNNFNRHKQSKIHQEYMNLLNA